MRPTRCCTYHFCIGEAAADVPYMLIDRKENLVAELRDLLVGKRLEAGE